MRKLILITSAAVLMPFSSWGEDITCTLTKDCTELGYNSSVSCDNGVKCPWGEAWFCPPSPPEACEIGSILYSDMTCYKEAQAGKTPIGVVVYVDGLGGGQALALKSLDTEYSWGGYGTDISGLTNYRSASAASTDYASCENSKIIMAAGDKDTYPAVWAANEYSTEGTSAGDWCLPAAGIFTLIYNNKSVINTGFSRANGTQFTTSSSPQPWSSSEYDSGSAWYSYVNANYRLYGANKNYYYEVRPVFEFVQTFEGVCKASQQYTCKGDGYAGGVGDACAGKYSECSCTEGYEWWLGKCVIPCETVGSILYSDKTCSIELGTGKTPIGIVVYIDGNGGGQAMALKSLGNYYWSTEYVNISSLPDLSRSQASTDFASCENSEKIRAQGNSSTYPAAWAAYNYTTTGTKTGDWCLPAAGIFTSYYNNQSVINTGFKRANGTQFTASTNAWASTEIDYIWAWISDFAISSGLNDYAKGNNFEVRPVIEF